MRSNTQFENRVDAGRRLALELREYSDRPDVVVLALPRGGVPVGFEVASALRAHLDVFLVRKLGAPGCEELAMGAIASGGVIVLNDDVIGSVRIDQATVDEAVAREGRELQRREREYRGDRPPLAVAGKVVILVDDGIATGSTMRAAIAALRRLSPARIVVAAPTASASTCDELREEADECVAVTTPEPFHAVGLWYEDFSQTSDQEVCDLLDRSESQTPVATRNWQ
jgi:predicted phosphoribosyltransferase